MVGLLGCGIAHLMGGDAGFSASYSILAVLHAVVGLVYENRLLPLLLK